MNSQPNDSYWKDTIPLVVRTASAKKMVRLRTVWFALGILLGFAAAYFLILYLHPPQEYSKKIKPNNLVAQALPILAPVQSIPVKALPKPIAKVTPPAPKLVLPANLNVAVKRGDTLMSVLMARGIEREEAIKISQSMKKVYNSKYLNAGQSLQLHLDKSQENSEKPKLTSLSIDISPVKTIALARTKDSYSAKTINAPIFKGIGRAGGAIKGSLYQTATNAGLPPKMIAEIINALSYDVDFQRDIKEGDELDVVFERMHNGKDVTTGYGNILYISLSLSDRDINVYRHISPDGYSGYYSANGESVKKALLKTPINGAHITSSFGMRMHPLLGYSKMHKGIDFGAVTGTPIYAAGDGVVEEAGRKGGYGNYVRLKHGNTYSTAYAHASRIAKGVVVGAHIKQGQVIAYVGSTGSSTGPHLHYEILVGGEQVNPSGVKFRTGQTLAGHELAEFKKQVKQVATAIATKPRKTQVALR